MMAPMFASSPSLPSDPTGSHCPGLSPTATQLAREAAACHKRSNILLALTQQDLAEAKESLERCMADEVRLGRSPSVSE